MLSQDAITSVAERLVAAASSPARVIAFGSYARGDAKEDSDLDLLVVERTVPDHTREYLRLRDVAGNLGIGVDLLLLAEDDFEERRECWSTPIYWATREGKVVAQHA